MKLKKYILIGMTALLAVVACDNKKNNKDKKWQLQKKTY